MLPLRRRGKWSAIAGANCGHRIRPSFCRVRGRLISGHDERASRDDFMLMGGPVSAGCRTRAAEVSMIGDHGAFEPLRRRGPR
jgi:hypothetical protein